MPPSARGAVRRRQILEATLRVIGRGGIAAADHRTVAAEAGVPLGSTTYYFASKEDMAGQALHHVADLEIERLERESESLEGSSPDQIRKLLVAQTMDNVTIERLVLLAQYELYLGSARREDLRSAAERWDLAWRDFYRRALERLGTPDAASRAQLLCASLDGLVLQHLALEGDPDALRERCGELIRLVCAP